MGVQLNELYKSNTYFWNIFKIKTLYSLYKCISSTVWLSWSIFIFYRVRLSKFTWWIPWAMSVTVFRILRVLGAKPKLLVVNWSKFVFGSSRCVNIREISADFRNRCWQLVAWLTSVSMTDNQCLSRLTDERLRQKFH